MKFPRYSIDVSEYQQRVKSFLNDSECAVFIDTNVISQLYRLNDAARQDFYKWMDQCGVRFHVPVWVIHEYSNKMYLKKTKEYLSELDKIKTQAKEFSNISDFVKGYVGDSLLQGSMYQGKTDELKKDVDKIRDLLTKISNTINKNLDEQQRKVHEEIEQRMSNKSLSSDIYSLLPNLDETYHQRYENRIPPGYKDATKEDNRMGDLVIWKEILEYCKKNHIKKAILLSRDSKQDIVYAPEIQTIDNSRRAGESERIKIAKESLVYEFKITTGGTDFYIIDFKTFVRIFSFEYRNLAISFQIATAEEEKNNESLESDADTEGVTDANSQVKSESDNQTPSAELTSKEENFVSSYLGSAIHDGQYDTTSTKGCMDLFIDQLRSYNWYKQNPAIDKIMKISKVGAPDTDVNRSSVFVLGRNILQSAEGSSGSAITFIENFSLYIKNWEPCFKKALIDGILFEIYFDSNAEVRPRRFKATYFDEIMNNIKQMHIDEPYKFINSRLSKVKNRFVPLVGTDTIYKFNFKINSDGETTSLTCNGNDISETFKQAYGTICSKSSQIKNSLMLYYGISQDYIQVEGIPAILYNVQYIQEPYELPF